MTTADVGAGPETFDFLQLFGVPDRADAYRELRANHPLLRLDLDQPTWVLSRYRQVEQVLKDPQTRQLPEGAGVPPWLGEGPAAKLFRNQMVLMDPPDHSRMRSLVNKGFTPRTVGALRDSVDAAVVARLDELAGRGEVDMLTEFADFVPATAICSILGIPVADWPELVSHAVDFVNLFSPLPLDDETVARLDAACAYYDHYFGKLVEAPTTHGSDGIVGELVRAEQAGDRLSGDELVATLHSFLNAGYETTQTALSNGILFLLTYRDQWELLCARPELVDQAVEEILRWEAPVHFTRRFLGSVLDVDGQTLPAGSAVLLALAAANRDETRYDDTDRFDITREDSQQLAFSGGRHFCLGAYLARMELTIGFRRLVERFPNARLSPGYVPTRTPSLLFPGLQTLPVLLEP